MSDAFDEWMDKNGTDGARSLLWYAYHAGRNDATSAERERCAKLRPPKQAPADAYSVGFYDGWSSCQQAIRRGESLNEKDPDWEHEK